MAIEHKNQTLPVSKNVENPVIPVIDYSEKQEKACPVSNFIELISKKWVIPIVIELYRKTLQDPMASMRFNEISKILGDVNPRTLSLRLKELEDKQILNREQFNEVPLRVEYSLTEKGIELGNKFLDIDQWAKIWGYLNTNLFLEIL